MAKQEPRKPVKRPLPVRVVTGGWRRATAYLQRALRGPASRNGFLASLYFTFLSTRFYREHRAVLAGQQEFRGKRVGDKDTHGGFRRNVHRLEKALVMQPRRRTFAEGYIEQTVAQFAGAMLSESRIDGKERKWAGDILSGYFDVVDDTTVIARARETFTATGYARDEAGTDFVPYAKQDVVPSGIPFAQLRQLFIERRSVRWFEQRPVAAELLEQAVEAAAYAPTACNRLPYRFHACIDAEKAVELAGLAGGTAGFVHNIPCLIVVVGDMSNYVEERDRHLIYIDGSLAAMQLMLALQTLGLSSVPINWPDVDEREERMAKALGLAPFERPVMLIGVGYGLDDGLIPYSQKKPASLLLRIEK
ncbi:nitroreductase family protein [Novosphingobium resinovorum]|uniref:nitroreductase family protein n=1 Tax=Novosphingobium resinovorum TaxID=158500 RepID=UPI002ED3A303|nr:nitroreductase family protein [Novosphingobium resinovorum]